MLNTFDEKVGCENKELMGIKNGLVYCICNVLLYHVRLTFTYVND